MYMSILGDRRASLPAEWTKETIVSVLADAQIDASAGAGTGATVTFIALAGEAVIRVPPRQPCHRRWIQRVGRPEN